MEIRPFSQEEKGNVIALFRLNTPHFFSPFEEADLIRYLEQECENYYVVERRGELCACGGYNRMANAGTMCISWDIVNPELQNTGIGSALLEFRIAKIVADENIHTLVVRTSQLVFPFYEKHGFILQEIITDYWARGFDLYRMQKSIR